MELRVFLDEKLVYVRRVWTAGATAWRQSLFFFSPSSCIAAVWRWCSFLFFSHLHPEALFI
jgi:hypothetical protein